MRYNDITLDGLIKDFAKIVKANGDQVTYDLPENLLNTTDAITDINYYEDILKSTASERSKLYGLVSDDLMHDAHPQGTAKLEGISGADAQVEDLYDTKAKMEQTLKSEVKTKKSALYTKLIRLSSLLAKATHTDLAKQVNAQLSKIADDVNHNYENDVNTELTYMLSAFKDSLDMILSAVEHAPGIDEGTQAKLPNVKEQSEILFYTFANQIVTSKFAEAKAKLVALAQLVNPCISAVAQDANVSQLIPAYKKQLSLMRDLVTSPAQQHNKVKTKTDVAGLDKVYAIIDLYEQPLMELLPPPIYTGTVRTWAGLDHDLRKYFNLYPSNVKSIPANGKSYSNWQQLATLVKEKLETLKAISGQVEQSGKSLPEVINGGNFSGVDVDSLRQGLTPGIGPKVSPMTPVPPLSLN